MLMNEYELLASFFRSGFESLFLVVKRQSNDGQFFGYALLFTDTGGTPDRATVAFDRVECWENITP
jgi:hypothetical protein